MKHEKKKKKDHKKEHKMPAYKAKEHEKAEIKHMMPKHAARGK